MSFLLTRSTLIPASSKAFRTVPRVILTSSVFVVTKADMPESITLSIPSTFDKATRALFAAPQPPPLKDTVYPWMVDAATSSASAGAAKATGVIAPKAHIMPILIFAFIAGLDYSIACGLQVEFFCGDLEDDQALAPLPQCRGGFFKSPPRVIRAKKRPGGTILRGDSWVDPF